MGTYMDTLLIQYLINRLIEELNVKVMDPGDLDPQIAGGLGAALFAEALVKKARKKSN